MTRSARRGPAGPIIFMILALLPRNASAQLVHLHDADSEHLAREALQTLSKLEAPEASVFQGMLRNLDAAHQRSLTVLWERGQANLASRCDRIVEWSWDGFAKDLEDSRSEFMAAFKRALAMRQGSAVGLDNLRSRIQSAEAQVKAVKEELARHDSGEAAMSRAIEHYESALGEIQKIAADPELARKLRNLELDKTQGYLKKLRDLAKNAETQGGLRPLYLDLGLSLAILEIDELKAELEYHRWTLGAANERMGRLKKILGCRATEVASGAEAVDLGAPRDPCDATVPDAERGKFESVLQAARASDATRGQNAFGAKGDELIMVTIARLARSAHREEMIPSETVAEGQFSKRFPSSVALRELLDHLATYASIVGYQKFLLEVDENEDNFQSRRESILLTQIEDRKLDLLLSHALQGLLAYQGGGLRPIDLLNLAGSFRP